MRVIRDFACQDCGIVKETLIDNAVQSIACVCGGKMDKILSMPMVVLDGTDPSLPGAWHKWADRMESKAKRNAKRDSE